MLILFWSSTFKSREKTPWLFRI